MRPRLSDDKRAAIREDIKAGKARSQIARDHDVSATTVTNIANEAGLAGVFDRKKTENATRARLIDLKALRTELSQDLMLDARELRKRAWEPYTYYIGTKDGAEMVQLELPPLGEVRNVYTSIGIMVDKHVVLSKHDADNGADDAKSLLAGLGEALSAAAEQLDDGS